MRYLVTVLFLITLFFLSCRSSKIEKMSSHGASLTEEEISVLSQDCDLVHKMITKGLMDVSNETDIHTTFMHNDFLVSLLKVTPCLKGKTKDQITKLFGKHFRNCGDPACEQLPFKYYFHNEDDPLLQFYTIWFRFKGNRLERISVSRSTRINGPPLQRRGE